MISVSKGNWCGWLVGGGRVLGEFRTHGGSVRTGWGIGPNPPNARGGWGEGRLLLTEGEQEDDLEVVCFGRGWPLRVFTNGCCAPWDSTGPRLPSG